MVYQKMFTVGKGLLMQKAFNDFNKNIVILSSFNSE